MSPSYQLPDLLNLSRAFELRTNRACRSVTLASESWLLTLKGADLDDVLTKAERANLHSLKVGLLAALCFPGCDATQLRLLADFLTFVILSDGRMRKAHELPEYGWLLGADDIDREDGVVSLSNHTLFQYITPQIRRVASRTANGTWEKSFASSVHRYRSAQTQTFLNRNNKVVPSLEEYMKLRRNQCGLDMLFDLIELTETATVPVLNATLSDRMESLKRIAADIIACSLDVVSFNNDQAQGNSHNLISILVTHRALSLQGALTFAGSLIKELFDSFAATERSLLDPPTSEPNHSRIAPLYLFPSMWFSSIPSSGISKSDQDENTLSDLHGCVQSLRDCIIGTINWAYETELYFGKKGEEIRTFGWVFLNSAADEE